MMEIRIITLRIAVADGEDEPDASDLLDALGEPSIDLAGLLGAVEVTSSGFGMKPRVEKDSIRVYARGTSHNENQEIRVALIRGEK